MSAGTPFNRQFVLMLDDGSVVLDWGDGLYQDVFSGDFMQTLPSPISHTIRDEDLEILKRAGRVEKYNKQQVFFNNLRERPYHTIE